jgi:hypothetical protein
MAAQDKRSVRLNLEVKFDSVEDIGDSRYKVALSATGSVSNTLEQSITVTGLDLKIWNTADAIFKPCQIRISSDLTNVPAGENPAISFQLELETVPLPQKQVEQLLGDAKDIFCREDMMVALYCNPQVPNTGGGQDFPYWPHPEDRQIWLKRQIGMTRGV